MASASEELFWSDEEETKKSPLEEKFDKAAAAVRNLSGTLSQQNLLYLYGRYKVS